ncbi:unnamed protein product, partial [Ectocarpus sp. 13 AM-2016]
PAGRVGVSPGARSFGGARGLQWIPWRGGGREDPHHRKGHQLLEAPARVLGVE